MTEPIVLGAGGLELHAGDHLCVFYRGEKQRDEVLLPYLRSGLDAGDKCLCVVDDPGQLPLDGYVDQDHKDTAPDVAGCLEVLRSDQAYLADGGFATEAMLRFWDNRMRGAIEQGFGFVRAAGEMTWALRDLPGVEQLIPYEAELNRNLRDLPQVILCLYDLERFTNGRLLLDVMRTHPKVLLSGAVVDNPWYVEPDSFLATLR